MPTPVEPAGPARFTDVRRVAETGSTNTDLLELVRAGAPEGIVLVADHQTAGRGRLGRTWSAPAGSSLLVSVLLRPTLPAGRTHLTTVAAGLAAADAVEEVAGFRPGLKWPNDLVVETPAGARKLAGLLAESVVHRGEVAAVVVGMGMNARWPEPLPEALASAATTVSRVAGREVGPTDLLGAYLRALDRRYGTLVAGGGVAATAAAHRRGCATLGRRVAVELGDGSLEGTAVDVDDDGHLVLDLDDGGRRSVTVGDVVHLRPAAT